MPGSSGFSKTEDNSSPRRLLISTTSVFPLVSSLFHHYCCCTGLCWGYVCQMKSLFRFDACILVAAAVAAASCGGVYFRRGGRVKGVFVDKYFA